MTRGLRTLQLLAILTLLTGLLGVALQPAVAQAATPSEIRNQLERRINHAREERGLRRLRVSDKIQWYAQDHAGRMGDLNLMFHDTDSLWNEVPGTASWVAENVGYVPDGPGAARRMHKAFMDSTGHRQNILTRRATHMGLGVVKRDGRVWVVQRFADLW